jgi:hypothetical protein
MSKVMVNQVQDLDDEKKGISRNDKIGFSCLNYMVMENCGSFEVKIAKKVNEDFVCILKTVEASAKAGKKFKAVDEMITLSKSQSEYSVKIEIIDDAEYNEDLEFFIEIYDEQGARLAGDDTQTKITIQDCDEPGTICFDSRKVSARRMDKFVYIQLVRKGGAAGEISCRLMTNVVAEVNNQAVAVEYQDFCPIDDRVYFKHQETERLVKIQLLDGEDKKAEEKGTSKGENEEEDGDKSKEEAEINSLVFQVKL